MEEFLKLLLTQSHGLFAYASVFGVLVACGLGIPLPEDVSLVLGGFLAHQGAAHLPIMMAVGFVGILVGDTFIYLAGRRIGGQVGNGGHGFLARIVTPEKRARVQGLFKAHGQKIVMIARFLPGVRAVTYFTAGSAHMRYLNFILWDGLAALASAPLFVYLGYRFGEELEWLVHKVKEGELAVIAVLGALVVGYLLFKRARAAAEKREADTAALPSDAERDAAPLP